MIKVKIAGRTSQINLPYWIPSGKTVTTVYESDVLVLPGGSDWNPEWYNHRANSETNFYNDTDLAQMKDLLFALKNHKFILGICRGLQGIHHVAGGTLFQHVNNHQAGHLITDIMTNKKVWVNSMHHQMVDLDSISQNDYLLIGYAEGISSTFMGQYGLERKMPGSDLLYKDGNIREPEVVYYNKINGLGFQYHPEMMVEGSPGLLYSREVFDECYNWFKSNPCEDNEDIIKRLENKIFNIERSHTKTYAYSRDNRTPYDDNDCCDILPATTTTSTSTSTKKEKNAKDNWIGFIQEL